MASEDGTIIRVESEGSGPGILLVHGSACDGSDWRGVLGHLPGSFRVHVMHRRGRAGSGDAPSYALERECEDVLAVVEKTGAQVIVGHSFGALVCLEAMPRLPTGVAIILIEPPIFALAVPPLADDVKQQLQPKLEGVGQREGMEALVEAFMVHAAQASAEDIAAMKQDEAGWSTAVACAATLPREAGTSINHRWEAERFTSLPTTTLLLAGTDTAPVFKAGIDSLSRVLEHATVAWLSGQGHMSINTAPDVVAKHIAAFADRPAPAKPATAREPSEPR